MKDKYKELADMLKTEVYKPVTIDVEEIKRKLKESQDEWSALKESEEKRISDMKCPSCDSTDKGHHVKYESNGIIGPGSHSRVTEDYYICQKCGIHYSDLNYKKLPKYPDGAYFM